MYERGTCERTHLGVFEYLKVGFICTNEELKMQRNCCVAAQDRFQLLESVSTDTISIVLYNNYKHTRQHADTAAQSSMEQ